MARPQLTIKKLQGGLGRRITAATMTTGVVLGAVATASMDLDQVYEFNSLQDAELLGLNEAYDTVNKVLVYHRINRLFQRNPSIKVWFMPVAQATTLVEMWDKDNAYMSKVLRQANGEVRQAFCALNPTEDYVPTILNGFDEDSMNAILKAQDLADFEFSKDRNALFLVECRSLTGTATGSRNFRTLETEAPDVMPVTIADNDISVKLPIYNGYAAVEDVAGFLSKASVSQNIGELVSDFNLTDEFEGIFLNAGLSSGKSITEYTDDEFDTFAEHGHVFATSVNGITGFYISDTHTASKRTSDYAYAENVRTINEMIRSARVSLLPRVKGRIAVDPVTGKIDANQLKELEAVLVDSQDDLVRNGDLSGGVVAYINPDQDILATSELSTQLVAVPQAIGRQIKLNIGFRNPKNA